MFLLGALLGGIVVILITSIIISDEITERYNAERRALIHFRKLQTIERILRQDEIKKEFAVFTVKKLKEVINDRKINQ